MNQYTTNIPTSTINNSGGGLLYSSILSIVLIAGLIVIFIILYFFLSKFLKSGNKNKNLGIIKKIYIDNNNYLGILKVLSEYYLVLFSSSSSTLIKKLKEDELNELIGEKDKFIKSFSYYLDREKDINE